MSGVKVLLWFDVEDYITPESDDALKLLLELLDAKKIRGTFKLVGEKARVLKERGRNDILEMLLKQDVGYHTDMHSQHPTVSEYLENWNFKEGSYCFEREESKGLNDVVEITGKTASCYGQPGASWAPQVFPVLRKWNIPTYLDDHFIMSVEGNPFWFGGILNLTRLQGIMRMDLVEGGLEEAKGKFDRLHDKFLREGSGFVSIYYHPCEFSTTAFWDSCNFAEGKNTPRSEWRTSPLRTKEEMAHYVAQLGRFIDYILSKENTSFITSSEIPGLEKSRQNPVEIDELIKIAGQVKNEIGYYVEGRRSLAASEIFSLFCKQLWNETLQPELYYGPEAEVETEYTGSVKVKEIKEAVKVAYPEVYGYPQLPDAFMVKGKKVNPVDMTCTLAEIIKKSLGDEDIVEVRKGYLKSQVYVNENDDWGVRWVIFSDEFKVPNIIRMTKLQSWTLKPALF